MVYLTAVYDAASKQMQLYMNAIFSREPEMMRCGTTKAESWAPPLSAQSLCEHLQARG